MQEEQEQQKNRIDAAKPLSPRTPTTRPCKYDCGASIRWGCVSGAWRPFETTPCLALDVLAGDVVLVGDSAEAVLAADVTDDSAPLFRAHRCLGARPRRRRTRQTSALPVAPADPEAVLDRISRRAAASGRSGEDLPRALVLRGAEVVALGAWWDSQRTEAEEREKRKAQHRGRALLWLVKS